MSRTGPRLGEAARDGGFAQAREVMNLLPHAVLTVEADGAIVDANAAAESFFDLSRAVLRRRKLGDLVPFDPDEFVSALFE